ncbi:MAG: J domain-containing protein [Methylococcales bacterium]|nr:J domain-containing protein [Methylococcales bacterium]
MVVECGHCLQKMRTVKPTKPQLLVCVKCKKRSQVSLNAQGKLIVNVWLSKKNQSQKKAKPEGTEQRKKLPKVKKARDPSPWFRTLGLPVGSSMKEIKLARKKMMQKVHPDKVAHLDYEQRVLAEESSKKVNAAYKNLVTYLEGHS